MQANYFIFLTRIRVNEMGMGSSLSEPVFGDHLIIKERVPKCINFQLGIWSMRRSVLLRPTAKTSM